MVVLRGVRVLQTEGKPEGCSTTGSNFSLLILSSLGQFTPPVSYVITSLVGKTLGVALVIVVVKALALVMGRPQGSSIFLLASSSLG